MSGIYDLCLGTYSICGANVVPLFMFNFWCLMDFDRFVKYNNVLDEIEKKLPRKCTLLDNQTRATICVWVQVLSAVHDQYWSTASHIFDSISVLIRFWLWAVGQNQFHVLCSTSCTTGIFFGAFRKPHTHALSILWLFSLSITHTKKGNYHLQSSGKKEFYNF